MAQTALRELQITKVNSRQFRTELSRFLNSACPVAITSHGKTVGYYIPVRPNRDDCSDAIALESLAEQLQVVTSALPRRPMISQVPQTTTPQVPRADPMKHCPEQSAPDDEVVREVQLLRGGRKPEADLMRTLSAVSPDDTSRSWLINFLRKLVSRGTVLTPAEIVARVQQGLGSS